jgi:alpha-D-ribose 1-methylphosphonate 5-triphosphate synthase subunit PhnH
VIDISFENPAHDAARAFRVILDAVANPGLIYPFTPTLSAPAGLGSEAAAVALTLCDFQTPIWLENSLRTSAISQYLRFHTGAPIASSRPEAMFALMDAACVIPDLAKFPSGTPEYPDRSVTLIVKTEQLTNSMGIVLKGPGIQTTRSFNALPVSESFWNDMIASRANFPLGIDVIFVAPRKIAAVPRSTQISIGGAA